MTEVSAVSDAEWKVWRTFNSMRRQLDRELERQLQRDADISGPDYEILLTLFESPDRQLRVRELVEHLGWEKSRVSHQISRMEKRELVLRTECNTDGRGTWVGITADGRRALLGAMRDHALTVRKYFFDVLSEEEKAAILGVSERVIATIEPVCIEAALNGELDGDGELDLTDELTA
jgi:DNA-binding MarR family transcriptional regulator